MEGPKPLVVRPAGRRAQTLSGASRWWKGQALSGAAAGGAARQSIPLALEFAAGVRGGEAAAEIAVARTAAMPQSSHSRALRASVGYEIT